MLPGEWPTGSFDLIVLSEILYYFGGADLGQLLRLATLALRSGGHLIAVHWGHPAPDHVARRRGRRGLAADRRLARLARSATRTSTPRSTPAPTETLARSPRSRDRVIRSVGVIVPRTTSRTAPRLPGQRAPGGAGAAGYAGAPGRGRRRLPRPDRSGGPARRRLGRHDRRAERGRGPRGRSARGAPPPAWTRPRSGWRRPMPTRWCRGLAAPAGALREQGWDAMSARSRWPTGLATRRGRDRCSATCTRALRAAGALRAEPASMAMCTAPTWASPLGLPAGGRVPRAAHGRDHALVAALTAGEAGSAVPRPARCHSARRESRAPHGFSHCLAQIEATPA